MSLRSGPLETVRSEHPLTTELAAVLAVLAAVAVWEHVARAFVLPDVGLGPAGRGYAGFDSLLVTGVVTGGVLLAGAAAIAGVYVAGRDVEVGGARPTGRASTVAGAALAPVALVALTKLVAAASGTTYAALFQRGYGEAATAEHVAVTTALLLFVVVPMLLLVCQVIVQGGLRRVVGGDAAVALTTLVAGFLLVDATGGLAMLPGPGRLAGAALFVVAVAVATYGSARFDRRWLGHLSLLPVALLVGATVVSGVAAVETVPAVLFVGVKVAVLWVAAYAYERTASLLTPALTYAGFLAASEAVVFFLEAGVQPL